MKIYLVGGAVRDELLGLPIKEKDWVVVGATPSDMLKKRFRQVGKDFPVFLHPETNEEYALARKERKIGRGYTGFDFDVSENVTLEEDLKRRDFTINAIAKTERGEMIDPYHGQNDLKEKILRHVSPAFSEDPVRILRAARFLARFAQVGFSIADETMTLMRKMVASGEVDALVSERVWKEWERTLLEKNPEKFFEVLSECGALSILFPEKVDVLSLIKAAQISSDPEIRFAVLFHDYSPPVFQTLCERYRIPNAYRELSVLIIKYVIDYKKCFEKNPDTIFQLFQSVDAFRREERFKKFLLAAEIISGAALSDLLLPCFDAAKKISAKEVMQDQLTGKQMGEAINQKRREVIAKLFL